MAHTPSRNPKAPSKSHPETPPKTPSIHTTALVPPSPNSAVSLYQYTRNKHDELKFEVKVFTQRLLQHLEPKHISDLVLETHPCHLIYEIFVDVIKSRTTQVIVISDTSTLPEEEGSVGNATKGNEDGEAEGAGGMAWSNLVKVQVAMAVAVLV